MWHSMACSVRFVGSRLSLGFSLYTPSINPRLTGFKRNKNKSYEYFQAHDDVVTVALFAPDNLLPLRPPPPSDAGHMLMVTAGMKGDVRVFENVGAAEKL